ncbi:polyphosphoinositide phosphatase Fig4 [Patellaria atrata CBS 101060]|uniref:Polyphosphoinositide phosphatase Fig4 n=1 Tax=Patellaria atrata CBS 101060 TaxID=1346257 RepID=A0A9P4VRK8_9PEZI|nr:polyphosphoinositide phosphatase Fig4 [Patellaria atrata CBS 101060]
MDSSVQLPETEKDQISIPNRPENTNAPGGLAVEEKTWDDKQSSDHRSISESVSVQLEGDDEEPPIPQSFQRTNSPPVMQRNKNAAYGKVGDDGIHKMHRFSLYETNTRFYLIGGDLMDRHFRVLKIDRTSAPGQLNIFEDDIVYDKLEMNQLLNAIDDGNKHNGGLKLKCSSWGILGFIRFTEAYYMILITKKAHVAMIGGHYIYQVDGTELVPITTGASSRFMRDRNPEESRFLGILNNLDLTRSFYFSYSYNITRTLQHNIIREREALAMGKKSSGHDFNSMFVWNQYLLEPALKAIKSTYDWCLPITHGFVDQSSLDIFGRQIYITLIARRSRFFAGARFLKRGANDLGYVANDVETEQIVSEEMTTSLHAPGPRLYANPMYTSYVQHRGSIPLHWTQDNTGLSPKPDIDLNLVDPFYSAAAMHFDNLFERYGSPVFVLNLIKSRERTPRETKLLHEYQRALQYLNQSLPKEQKIQYKAFDMSRAAKTRGSDVIGELEVISEDILQQTGFFHNGDSQFDTPHVQNGVARTNCTDCLDRTNAAQFVIGKKALGRQLQALGIIEGNTVEYDTDAVNIFTHMYHDHGDTIAIQYGGSHLVNTMATYRKINAWQSHSRDMVESFKRYYQNSFLDAQRQEAYNLFLGNYIFVQGQPMLWDLTTDYYLHHSDPRSWANKGRKHYIHWYTPSFIAPRVLPSVKKPQQELIERGVMHFDDYYLEYYRPRAISSFRKIFSFTMNSTLRYLPKQSQRTGPFDMSPFRVRKVATTIETPDSPEKKPPRKGVKIVIPHSDEEAVQHVPVQHSHTSGSTSPMKQSILRETTVSFPELEPTESSQSFTTFQFAERAQWTFKQFHSNSLNPSVAPLELKEYQRYVSHPLNLPLVTTTDVPDDQISLTFRNYEEQLSSYEDFLVVPENPLDITEEDGNKKRYKAYRQWLRGKSLFKQSKIDPEYRNEAARKGSSNNSSSALEV